LPPVLGLATGLETAAGLAFGLAEAGATGLELAFAVLPVPESAVAGATLCDPSLELAVVLLDCAESVVTTRGWPGGDAERALGSDQMGPKTMTKALTIPTPACSQLRGVLSRASVLISFTVPGRC
jgi:hypothetical protein